MKLNLNIKKEDFKKQLLGDQEFLKGDKGLDGTNGKDGYTPIKGVDYVDGKDGLNGKGFQFINPNASRTCGCGESFAV